MRACDERRRRRARRCARRRPRVGVAFVARLVVACVVARVVAGTNEARGDDRDDGANTPGVNMVLYARAPTLTVGETTTASTVADVRESVSRVRCLAAIASASGRELVLTTDAEARAATAFVAPTTARWRYWREGDDVRVKDGNEDWCVKVNRAGTTMAAVAVMKRFKTARAACVTFETARDECGDEVEMGLTSRAANASAELPEEIAALVREKMVLDRVISDSLVAEQDEGLALRERRREERVEARKAARRGIDVTGYLGRLEVNATHPTTASTTSSASVKEGIPEMKILRGAARRMGGGAARAVDSSRALIYFAAAVGAVGFFVNIFATSRQASKRDELAALVLDPNGCVGKEYASAPKRRENQRVTLSLERHTEAA